MLSGPQSKMSALKGDWLLDIDWNPVEEQSMSNCLQVMLVPKWQCSDDSLMLREPV